MILITAVSYFGSSDMKTYLASLQEQSFSDWQLVVVDNSESDSEAEALQSVLANEERAKLMRAPSNLGYLAGGRWGIEQVSRIDADWIIISNTDVKLDSPDALAILADTPMDDVGIVAPAIRSGWDGRDQNPYKAIRPNLRQMNFRVRMLGNPALAQLITLTLATRAKLHLSNRQVQPAGAIYAPHGSFIILSRIFFQRGGHLTFPLFLFGEEMFLAEQCRRLGIRVLYQPGIHVAHEEHGQTGYIRSPRMLRLNAEAVRYCRELIRDGDEQ